MTFSWCRCGMMSCKFCHTIMLKTGETFRFKHASSTMELNKNNSTILAMCNSCKKTNLMKTNLPIHCLSQKLDIFFSHLDLSFCI